MGYLDGESEETGGWENQPPVEGEAGSGNLNRNIEAGVTDRVIGIHVHHLWLESGQLGFIVVAVGTDNDAVAHISQVSGGTVHRNHARTIFGADDVGRETLAIIDVVNLDLFKLAHSGEIPH